MSELKNNVMWVEEPGGEVLCIPLNKIKYMVFKSNGVTVYLTPADHVVIKNKLPDRSFKEFTAQFQEMLMNADFS